MTTPKHRVVLCADDFGLSEGICRGVLELARAGRISATSAMVNHRWWPHFAPELRQLGRPFGVGLHLTLTAGAPLGPMPGFFAPRGSFPSLGQVLAKALSFRLPSDEIRQEIHRQLRAFEDAFGRPPDFVDGHQHVHALPGIRHALIDVLGERKLAGLWLRDPGDRPVSILRRRFSAPKAAAVAALSAGFGREVRAAGFALNEGFSGFSNFTAGADAAPVFEAAFDALGSRSVVMCHPGFMDDELRASDPIAEARSAELAYLSSPRFAELLETRKIELVPAPSA